MQRTLQQQNLLIYYLAACKLFPLISRITCITNTSATLIDNIYVTNNLTVTHTDVLYADISDNFLMYEIFPPKENKILYRYMNLKNKNNLCNALLIID